mgnify:CR=1 FL=1
MNEGGAAEIGLCRRRFNLLDLIRTQVHEIVEN